jgi:hypothetical protein
LSLEKGITELRLEVYYKNIAAIKAYKKRFSKLIVEMRKAINIQLAQSHFHFLYNIFS